MGIFHRLPILRVVAATLAFVSVNAALTPKTRVGKLNPEDARFWDRILEEAVSSVDPNPPSQSPMALTPSPVTLTQEPIVTEGPAPTRPPVTLSSQPTPVPIVQPTSTPTSAPITISPPPSPPACALEVSRLFNPCAFEYSKAYLMSESLMLYVEFSGDRDLYRWRWNSM